MNFNCIIDPYFSPGHGRSPGTVRAGIMPMSERQQIALIKRMSSPPHPSGECFSFSFFLLLLRQQIALIKRMSSPPTPVVNVFLSFFFFFASR